MTISFTARDFVTVGVLVVTVDAADDREVPAAGGETERLATEEDKTSATIGEGGCASATSGDNFFPKNPFFQPSLVDDEVVVTTRAVDEAFNLFLDCS